MTDQLALTDGHVVRAPIAEDFWRFHRENPAVYRGLVALAREGRDRGARKLGMKQLFEVLRWNRSLSTADWTGFKLNNNYTSFYARLIMECEPDLTGIFDIRRLHGRYIP